MTRADVRSKVRARQKRPRVWKQQLAALIEGDVIRRLLLGSPQMKLEDAVKELETITPAAILN